jgi:hypothetical protein
MSVRTDDTGLHADDCGCMLCETGYRPTDRERETARRSLARAALAMAKLQGKTVDRPSVRLSHTIAPMTRVPPPMGKEELEAMAADIAAMRKKR